MSSPPTYRFEDSLQHYGDGHLDIWIVMSATRGSRDPMAKCYSRDDAVLIVDALNAAAEVS
jgi:hypothetical protein